MYINECVIRLYKLTAGNWARGSVLIFNPGCSVASYCGLKIHAVPNCWDFPILFLDIFMNMPTPQNRSNRAFR